MNNDSFSLTDSEEEALDQELLEEGEEAMPEGWVHISLAVPEDFYHLYQDTLMAYKHLRETDKAFPAFEAMVMEARNALPEIQGGL